jgi:glycosyltransferase involved in cell wall biosynthesis
MKVSVIICTYNRDKHIHRALESLIHQTASKEDYEIVVIDNNSTDQTAQIIKDFNKKYAQEYNIITAVENKQGLSYARNTGIDISTGDIVSFIDDDAIAQPDFIEKIIKNTMQFPSYLAFGGKVLPKYENGTEPGWMSSYIERIISVVDMGDKYQEFKKTYPVGCNMIFRREIFDKVGKFNTRLRLRSDDKYIFLKIKEAGYSVLYLPDVVVQHFIDTFRTTPEYVKKISLLNGKSEYIRIDTLDRNTKWKKLTRLSDYLFKVIASLALWGVFALKGEGVKGKILFLSLWNQLKGFVNHQDVKEY